MALMEWEGRDGNGEEFPRLQQFPAPKAGRDGGREPLADEIAEGRRKGREAKRETQVGRRD